MKTKQQKTKKVGGVVLDYGAVLISTDGSPEAEDFARVAVGGKRNV